MLIARIVLIYKRAYLFTRKKILTKEKVMRYHGFALNKSTYLFHLYFFFKLTINTIRKQSASFSFKNLQWDDF